MKNKFIRLGALLLAVLLLTCVVGCSGGETQNQISLVQGGGEDSDDTSDQLRIQEKIKTMGEDITFLQPYSVEAYSCQMKAARYEQLTGGKVTILSSNGYSEMQQKLVSLHMSDEAPDVYDFTNQDYPSLLYKNLLSPLDDLIDLNDTVLADKKVYMEALRWDGKCYFIPDIGTKRDLWVNAAILRDAGIPENEWPNAQYKAGTWDWNAFRDIVKRVSDPTRGIYGTLYHTNLQFAFPASAGVDFVKLTENGFVSNAKDRDVTRAMGFYKEILTNPNYSAINTGEDAIELFKRGKICMWYAESTSSGDDILGEQLANGDIFLTAFPRDPEKTEHYRMGDIFGTAIPAGAKHKNGAVAFILCEFASDYYKNQIDELNKEEYKWDDATFEYRENDLLKRPATICFSLGFKEIQNLIGKACMGDIYKSDWTTIANTFDPAVQQEIDTQH